MYSCDILHVSRTCTYSFPVNRDFQSQISWKYYNIHRNCTYHYVHSVHNTKKKLYLYITYIWPILWHINMFQVTKYISFDWNVDFCKNLEIFFQKILKVRKNLEVCIHYLETDMLPIHVLTCIDWTNKQWLVLNRCIFLYNSITK